MPDRTDLVYLCEESLEGTLCCVYESYTRREVPFDILPEGTPTLYPSRPVVSDEAHAARVWRSLLKLDPEAAAWVRDGWCSCMEGREYRAYRFIRALYAHGPRIMGNLADPDVGEFFKLVRFQRNEAHLMKEFCGSPTTGARSSRSSSRRRSSSRASRPTSPAASPRSSS